MALKKLLACILLATCVIGTLKAQDPAFSQYYASPLYLNPAFAGSTKCPRVVINYRNQWPALKGAFVTTSASFDQYVDEIHGGLGIIIMNDRAGQGALTTNTVGGIYSYQMNINRNVAAKIGIQGTYFQKSVDLSGLNFGDQIESRNGFVYSTNEVIPNQTKSYADFSTGAIVYSSNIYGGFAVSHLTQPNEAFLGDKQASVLPRKYTFHLGGIYVLGRDKKYSNTYISPNLLYLSQQSISQMNVGMYLGRGPLVGGLWYRTRVGKGGDDNFLQSDAVIILVGIQQGLLRLGYSYDATVSKLANASAGAHEISLGFQFECRPKKKKFRAIKCPVF